ncbi:amino acid adenylation domain-containing protein [Lentzea sp. NPDC059081]|uniref:amino acid adenylation domain-containing protein n=1 Tax=Lentzea sp. NPDC059081 TaxID=3346719 RepID=UPI0036774AB4
MNVGHLIYEQIRLRGDSAIAVAADDGRLTYRELGVAAGEVAAALLQAGVRPDDVVAVRLPRGSGLAATLLGVLWSGAAYLPLDPDVPDPRVRRMVDAAGARFIVTDEPAPAGVQVVKPGRDVTGPRPAHPDDLAYVVFTSGSTGEPKPVAVPRRALANHAVAVARKYALTAEDRVLQFANVAFDVYAEELFPTLAVGGRVVVMPEAVPPPARLEALLAREQVTVVNLPTSYWTRWTRGLGQALPASLRLAVIGSEAGHAADLRLWRQHCSVPVVNAYGLSETTITTTAAELSDVDEGVLPIGRPLAGMRAYVLDDRLRPVAEGTVGELYLGGAGLARGYVDRPGLTAERFVACPFEAGGRMYRTGDLVRTSHDGELRFEGRADDQVKIRGIRVEPEEVRAALEEHPGVSAAAVVVRRAGSGDSELVGYVVSEESAERVREWLGHRLPSHLVPRAVVRMERLPFTGNGKLDRSALPEPQGAATITPPRNAEEARLCALFAEVLGVAEVGVHSNFFELGGHSLLAAQLVGRLDADVTVRGVFDAPTPALLAGLVRARGTARAAVRPVERPDLVPLSPAQQRLWFLGQLGASPTYSLPSAIRLRGDLDRAALEAAVADVITRHEALRTVFTEHQGTPHQTVLPVEAVHVDLPVEHTDDLDAAIRQEVDTPFDLAADLPLRVRLFGLGPGEHVLLLTMNHIGTDGWSMRPLARDLHDAYAARLAGEAPDWSPLPVQYVDYTLWQAGLLGPAGNRAPSIVRQLDFWRRTLRDLPEDAPAADLPRPPVATGRGGAVPIAIGAEPHRAAAALARRTGTTVFMVVQAAVAAVLTRLGVAADVPIGTPVSGRGDPALDDLVGFFANTVVLRTDTSGDPTLLDLVRRVRKTDLDAFDHQDVPFDDVVEAVNPGRSLARNPLFQVMLLLAGERDGEGFRLPGLVAETTDVFTGAALVDLVFDLTERQSADGSLAGIDGRLEFAGDLYLPDSASLLAARFAALVERWIAEPDLPLSEVDLFVGAERSDVLHTWNATEVPLPDTTLPELVEKQVAATPQAVAIRSVEGEITFAELNERANRIAHLLLAHGIGPGDHVGVLLSRGPRQVEAFVGVLKCGAAYLPIDPAHPDDRIRFMIEDARPAIVLTADGSSPFGTVVLDDLADRPATNPVAEDRPSPLTPDTPNYVVYTSGSTGRPKGVVLPAKVLVNEMLWHATQAPYEPGSRVAQFSAVGFDMSEHEMLTALINGKTLCVPDDDTRADPARLARWLDEERVTELYATNAVMAAVYEAATEQGLGLRALRHLVQGGEMLQLTPAVRAFHAARPDLVLHNEYGPSETHGVTGAALPADPGDWPRQPTVGPPIWNTQVYVLDERLRPVPVGVVGELYLAGNNVAHGYLGQPGLTAARMVANPFGPPGTRMYRSGDMGRWRPGGALELVGRVDDQVKIRGVRVELGELNSVLTTHPAVGQAATVLREDQPGDRRLVAYVVPDRSGPAPTPADLRRHVAAAVPEAVVPSAFVVLDALPVNANGKVDQARLPKPARVGTARHAPTTDHETVVCDLFVEVLDAAEVGVHDNFFELGGHSLLVTRLVSRVRGKLGVELTVRMVFEAPTPAELAALLDAAV